VPACLRRCLGLIRRRPRTFVAAGVLLLCLGAAGAYGWTELRLRAAESALAAHDYDKARRLLGPCLKWRPGSGRAHFLAARVARCERRYDEAEAHLKACERQDYDPQGLAIERLLARVQLGDAGPASELWKQVEEDNPHSLAILEVLAQHYLDSYQLLRAKDCLNRYLERRPHDLNALLGRAYVYERLLYFAMAREDYRQAVEAHPDSDLARLRLAQTHLLAGDPAEALRHFRQLRQRRPEDVEVRLGLAKAQRQLGQRGEAKRLLDALLAEQPRRLAVLNERGGLALDEEDPARAETWLRRAVAVAPYDQTATNLLREALRRQGKDTEAKECEARLKKIDADLKRLHTISKAVMVAPNDPELRYEGGLLFLRNGEEAEGVRWLRTALRLAPGHRAARAALEEHLRHPAPPPSGDRGQGATPPRGPRRTTIRDF
jgi:tetratricopeptide (TPR) repeat protein